LVIPIATKTPNISDAEREIDVSFLLQGTDLTLVQNAVDQRLDVLPVEGLHFTRNQTTVNSIERGSPWLEV
jgi:hypothetical protein